MKKSILNLLSTLGVSVSRTPKRTDLLKVIELYRPRKLINYGLVRIGGANDGGYVIPDCLGEVRHCFSPGVDTTATFECDLADRGIDCHLIDYSVESPPPGLRYKSFTKKYIGPITSGRFVTLSDWIQAVSETPINDAILQMDIEGTEYSAILETPQELIDAFKVIVVELHGLNSLANIWFLRLFKDFSEKLTLNHTVVHLHPNNCSPPVSVRGILVHPVLEVTLIRSDLMQTDTVEYASSFPSPYDSPCVVGKRDYVLSPDWVGSNFT